jgi:multisubunit Na+/H+ antiporter MnhB subunit
MEPDVGPPTFVVVSGIVIIVGALMLAGGLANLHSTYWDVDHGERAMVNLDSVIVAGLGSALVIGTICWLLLRAAILSAMRGRDRQGR